MTFTVALPPRALSLNSRGHWTFKAELTRQWKVLAWGSCTEAMQQGGVPTHADRHLRNIQPGWQAATVTYLWRYKGNAPDPSSVIERCKPVLDGVVLAGLLPSDDKNAVKGFVVEYEKCGKPELVVTLREVR